MSDYGNSRTFNSFSPFTETTRVADRSDGIGPAGAGAGGNAKRQAAPQGVNGYLLMLTASMAMPVPLDRGFFVPVTLTVRVWVPEVRYRNVNRSCWNSLVSGA